MPTAAQDAFVADLLGVNPADYPATAKAVAPAGAVDPGAGGPGDASGGGAHARVFSDKAGTLAWMSLFDRFFQAKAKGLKVGNRTIDIHEFEEQYVWKVGEEIRHAIGILRGLNADSKFEADKIGNHALQAQAEREVGVSEARLNDSAKALTAGHYLPAYTAFMGALNIAWQARETIAVYNKKVIADADHMVTGLTIVRDAGFAALVPLGAAAGVTFITATAIGLAPVAAEVYTKLSTNEKVNWGGVVVDVLFTLIKVKEAKRFEEFLKGPCNGCVRKLLGATADSGKIKEAVVGLAKYLVEHAPEWAIAGLKAAIESIGAKKDPNATYGHILEEFYKTHTSPAFFEHLAGTWLLNKGYLKLGTKAAG